MPDPHTPIEETLAALSELVARGQGALHRLVELRRLAGRRRRLDGPDQRATSRSSRPRTSTPGSTATVEAELVPALEHTGQSLLPYFPLASGLLTGKYRRDEAAPPGSRLGRQSGCGWPTPTSTGSRLSRRSPPNGASRMLAGRDRRAGGHADGGSVIAGATSAEQVRQNVAAGTVGAERR